VNPLTEWACRKVPWILLPTGPANSSDKGYIREERLRNNDILHCRKCCHVERHAEWSFYHGIFQHLRHIAMGHFMTFTGKFCSCIVIKNIVTEWGFYVVAMLLFLVCRNPDAKYMYDVMSSSINLDLDNCSP
jgi:hypothetical protein